MKCLLPFAIAALGLTHSAQAQDNDPTADLYFINEQFPEAQAAPTHPVLKMLQDSLQMTLSYEGLMITDDGDTCLHYMCTAASNPRGITADILIGDTHKPYGEITNNEPLRAATLWHKDGDTLYHVTHITQITNFYRVETLADPIAVNDYFQGYDLPATIFTCSSATRGADAALPKAIACLKHN